MPSSSLIGKLGAVAVSASLVSLLIGSQPALAAQFAGTVPGPVHTVTTTTHQVTVVGSATRFTNASFTNPVQQRTLYPTIYNGVTPGYGTAPYGYGGTPYGYGTTPYGYGTTPYGYGTTPYGYGNSACVNGAGYGYPTQNATQMLVAPALGALVAAMGSQSPAGALLTGLLTSASSACGSPIGYGTTPYGTNPYGTTPYGTTPYGTTPYGYGTSPNGYGTTPYGTTPYGYGSPTPYGYGTTACANGAGYPYAQNTSQMLIAPALSAVVSAFGGQSPAGALLTGLLTSASTTCPNGYGYPATYPTGYGYPPGYAYPPNTYQQPYGYGPTQQPIVNNYYVTRVIRVYRRVPVIVPGRIVSVPVVPHVATFVPTPHVAAFVTTPHVATFVLKPHVATFVLKPHVSAFVPATHIARFATAPRVISRTVPQTHFVATSAARPVVVRHPQLANTFKPTAAIAATRPLTAIRPAVTIGRAAPVNVSVVHPDATVRESMPAQDVRNDQAAAAARSDQIRDTDTETNRSAASPVQRTVAPQDIARPVALPQADGRASDEVRPQIERPNIVPRSEYQAPMYRRPVATFAAPGPRPGGMYAAPGPRPFAQRPMQRAQAAPAPRQVEGSRGGGGARQGRGRNQ
jgi:hypothetical protein